MLSAEQLIIVAYLHAGTVLCRRCGEENEPKCKTGEAMSAYEAGEFAGSEGLTCDACGKEIIEADEWDCPYCGRGYYGDDAADMENKYYDNPATFKCLDDTDGCPGKEESE
jgi:hypothetical protein